MNVLVTGGAGYIGSHVVLALLDAGHSVVVIDDLSTGCSDNLPSDIPFFHVDIRDEQALRACFEKHSIDAIIHLAAKKAVGESMKHPELYFSVNVEGTRVLAQEARRAGVKKFVFSSSAAVYGNPSESPVTEHTPLAPESVYGVTKKMGEELLLWFGFTLVNLRYFNVVGYDPSGRITVPEKQPQNLFPILCETGVGVRERVQIFGTDYDTRDGTCERDYVHVTDLATAHVRALSLDESITLNLGIGRALSVRECVYAAQEVFGEFAVEDAPRRPGDPAAYYANPSRAQNVLGWEAQITDPVEMITTMKPLYE